MRGSSAGKLSLYSIRKVMITKNRMHSTHSTLLHKITLGQIPRPASESGPRINNRSVVAFLTWAEINMDSKRSIFWNSILEVSSNLSLTADLVSTQSHRHSVSEKKQRISIIFDIVGHSENCRII
jgi:hypothetical protein